MFTFKFIKDLDQLFYATSTSKIEKDTKATLSFGSTLINQICRTFSGCFPISLNFTTMCILMQAK